MYFIPGSGNTKLEGEPLDCKKGDARCFISTGGSAELPPVVNGPVGAIGNTGNTGPGGPSGPSGNTGATGPQGFRV